jgi:hypothetical protein
MTRTMILILLLAIGSLLATSAPLPPAGAEDQPGSVVPRLSNALPGLAERPHIAADRGCKPRAPVAVALDLIQSPASHHLELMLTIEPQVSFERLEWWLELPPGASASFTHGLAATTAHELTQQALHASLLPGRPSHGFALVVEGWFLPPGGAERERVVERRNLSWDPPQPGGLVRALRDAETDAVELVAELPIAHRSGR